MTLELVFLQFLEDADLAIGFDEELATAFDFLGHRLALLAQVPVLSHEQQRIAVVGKETVHFDFSGACPVAQCRRHSVLFLGQSLFLLLEDLVRPVSVGQLAAALVAQVLAIAAASPGEKRTSSSLLSSVCPWDATGICLGRVVDGRLQLLAGQQRNCCSAARLLDCAARPPAGAKAQWSCMSIAVSTPALLPRRYAPMEIRSSWSRYKAISSRTSCAAWRCSFAGYLGHQTAELSSTSTAG